MPLGIQAGLPAGPIVDFDAFAQIVRDGDKTLLRNHGVKDENRLEKDGNED